MAAEPSGEPPPEPAPGGVRRGAHAVRRLVAHDGLLRGLPHTLLSQVRQGQGRPGRNADTWPGSLGSAQGQCIALQTLGISITRGWGGPCNFRACPFPQPCSYGPSTDYIPLAGLTLTHRIMDVLLADQCECALLKVGVAVGTMVLGYRERGQMQRQMPCCCMHTAGRREYRPRTAREDVREGRWWGSVCRSLVLCSCMRRHLTVCTRLSGALPYTTPDVPRIPQVAVAIMKTVETRLLDMHDLEDVLSHLKIEVPGGAGADRAGSRTADSEAGVTGGVHRARLRQAWGASRSTIEGEACGRHWVAWGQPKRL